LTIVSCGQGILLSILLLMLTIVCCVLDRRIVTLHEVYVI
jgi:hypothetical protein